MGRHSPCAEVVEDEGEEILAAAEEDEHLVARILIRLSRSDKPLPRHAKRKPPPPVTTGALLPGTTWGGRRTRSRSISLEAVVAAKMEVFGEPAATADRGASPTTPLSWSGGSATGSSGSECGHGWPAASRIAKREAEICCSSEPIRSLHSNRLAAERCGDVHPRDGLEAAATSSDCRSKKMVASAEMSVAETSRTAAQVKPMRPSCPGSVGFRRPVKKKTVAELQELAVSLSLEQEKLHEELKKHMEIYHALLEVNMKLKNVESRVVLQAATPHQASPVEETGIELVERAECARAGDEPSAVQPVTAEDDRPKQSAAPAPRRTFPFDLNCLPEE